MQNTKNMVYKLQHFTPTLYLTQAEKIDGVAKDRSSPTSTAGALHQNSAMPNNIYDGNAPSSTSTKALTNALH